MTDRAPLLPQNILTDIPPLYGTENLSDPVVHAKLFTPWTGWTWFVTECNGEGLCFGLVSGHEVELGYFSLAELEEIKGPGGLRIERDLGFTASRLSEVRAQVGRQLEPYSALDKNPDEGRCCEFNAEAGGGNSGEEADELPLALPSPFEYPTIRMIETKLSSRGDSHPVTPIRTSHDAATVLSELIGDADREHFVALYLNGRHELTHAHIVSRGSAMSSIVHPREVFKAAVLSNAVAILVGHNHPSGDVSPSSEDREVLKRLKRAGELMGISVIDSVIVGPSKRFYASSTSVILPLAIPLTRAENDCVGEQGGRKQNFREALLERLCCGLLDDIDEVLERQGESWWDETVTSGRHHRSQAEKRLGREPYRTIIDHADQGLGEELRP